MNWDKAKTLVILILIILNAALFALVISSRQEYYLTSAQEKVVFDVLAKEGIGIYTELVDKYMPCRMITVSSKTRDDIEELKSMFFSSEDEVEVMLEFNKTVLRSGDKTLTIENDKLTFESGNGVFPPSVFTRERANFTAENFLSSMGEDFSGLKLENVLDRGSEYIFEYNEIYRNSKLFSNFCNITVDDLGVKRVEAAYYTPKGYTGSLKEIISPDEAILTFLYEARKKGIPDGAFIEKMELGYDFQEKTVVNEGGELRLVPCYRIYMAGVDVPYVINAYTNEIKGN